MAELIIPPELRERHRRGLAHYLATERPRLLDRRLEITGQRADGTTFPVELTITRIDVPGPPIFTGYIRDITDRKAAEAELRASRGRIVKAADEARRQLERDLHDGAQQRLVELALDLRMARARLDDEPAQAQELLDAALRDLEEATRELRELARGIHPAALTEGGLRPALEALTARSRIPARLVVVPDGRFPAMVEATAYFSVAEGLTNAARHAAAAHVEVEVVRVGDRLRVVVRDDGRGGAESGAGSGLRGLRQGAARLLEDAGFDVVAQAGDAEDLLRKVRAHTPDVAIIDVRMPPENVDDGLRAALTIRDELPDVGILMLSQYVEDRYLGELLAGGAEGVGYLLKDRLADVDRLTEAVQRVAAGGSVLDPEVVAQMLGRSRAEGPLDSLTEREREVLGRMAEGRTNRAIAEDLFVSERAVERHVTSIFTKLDLPTGEQDHRRVLAVLAYLRG
jgi:DNA-binding NarL/FixJ family response regulator/two-component sensor histidine kinase